MVMIQEINARFVEESFMRKNADTKLVRRTLFVLLVGSFLTFTGCETRQDPLGNLSAEERQALEEPFPVSAIVEAGRFPSPDGILEAVIATRATDATVATPTEIYIIPRGGNVTGEPFFRADHVTDISVTWQDRERLSVQAAEARPFRQEATQKIAAKHGNRTVKLDYRIDKLDPSGR